jgi:hypothetical protein
MSTHTLYTVVLFAHIVGVLGLFIGMGLQWMVVFRMRRAASVTQVGAWLALLAVNARLNIVSTVLILGAGVYLVLTAWSWSTPWIDVSLGAIAIMMALGIGVVMRRLRAVGQAAARATGLTPQLSRRIHDPLLWTGTQMGGVTALGVVFLMTTKPDLMGSLVTLAVALTLGAAVGWLTARPREQGAAPDGSGRTATLAGERAR